MTSQRQMKLDAIDAYPHMAKNPNLVFISADGSTAYALVRGAVACIQTKNGINFNDMTPEELAIELRRSFPEDF